MSNRATDLQSKTKKTDNSYFKEKIELRLETVLLCEKKTIIILEAYHGDGLIWAEVQKKTRKKLVIIPIEVKDNKKGFYLKGDNNKFIPLFDFEKFDIIDLDAYGVPFNQLEVVFDRKFKGYVHCTFIQSGMGRLPNKMLQRIGYSGEMIKKIPTLFSKKGIEKFCQYLACNKVQKIHGYFIDRKNYFYFKI